MGGARANSAATGNHETISRPSVTLRRLAVSRTPQSATGARARELALLQYHLPVHDHVLDADGGLVRLLERRAIDHRRRIEDGDVGVHPRLDEPAIGEADAVRRERRPLSHRELEWQELQVARIMAENAWASA